jgi:hypothetical protein
MEIGGGAIEIEFGSGEFGQSRQTILAWITDAARAIAGYYGGFPVSRVRLSIAAVAGDEIHGNTRSRSGTTAVSISVGRRVSDADLSRHWVMAHEFVHLAFPEVPDAHHWIEEGLATYVEPIARAQMGQLSNEKLWRDMMKGLPQGQPEPGDRGLDHTHTWGRTYWGGAMFCLLAELDIRERSGNRMGLQQGLRGVLAKGGNMEMYWPLADALRAADAATGVATLMPLYERMRATPVPVDLDDLWRRLGLAQENGRIVFDDGAPLASVRKAITQAPS